MAFAGVPRGPAPRVSHGRRKGEEKVFAGVVVELELRFRVDPRVMVSERNLNRHRKVINRSMMKYWHRKIRPKHFTRSGGRKYGYQRRTHATVVIKREQFGHNEPIKAKGLAESMTGSIKSLTATKSMGRLVMHGPWYLGQRVTRKRGGLSPDLKDELTRVVDKDAQDMAELGSVLLNKRLEQDKRKGLGRKRVKAAGPV